LRWRSRSPEATRQAARALAAALPAEGLVVALCGPLGAGKTLFAKGLAEGLGIDPAAVASPTFTIAHEHVAPDGRRLAHVDLFRIESQSELEAAGFLDWLEPGCVVVVEWSDRLPEALPAERIEVRLERPDPEGAPTERVLSAVASGPAARAALARWSAALAATGGGSR
jgi:tRNA threonylcarbamoyladenosine biosynthesis protein TsaE